MMSATKLCKKWSGPSSPHSQKIPMCSKFPGITLATMLFVILALNTRFSSALSAQPAVQEIAGTNKTIVADEVSFNRDIRPLLSNRCFACHGPDEESREAGLRFDIPKGDEGAIGYAIEPLSLIHI